MLARCPTRTSALVQKPVSRDTGLRVRFRFFVPLLSASVATAVASRPRKRVSTSGDTDVKRIEKSILLTGTVPTTLP